MENKKCFVDLRLLRSIAEYFNDLNCRMYDFDYTGRKLNQLSTELEDVIQTSNTMHQQIIQRDGTTVTIESKNEAGVAMFSEYFFHTNFKESQEK